MHDIFISYASQDKQTAHTIAQAFEEEGFSVWWDREIPTGSTFDAVIEKAIDDANIDPETLDYIIVAHNFGDVKHETVQSDILPCLASRVKHSLKIKNPKCVAYDILFGCPGWLEGVIQAQAFIKAGMAKRCLVVGTETLSRVVDKHDRDSMIYSDGAGATIIEETDEEGGILGLSLIHI